MLLELNEVTKIQWRALHLVTGPYWECKWLNPPSKNHYHIGVIETINVVQKYSEKTHMKARARIEPTTSALGGLRTNHSATPAIMYYKHKHSCVQAELLYWISLNHGCVLFKMLDEWMHSHVLVMSRSPGFLKLSRPVVRLRRLAAQLDKIAMSTAAANGEAPTAAILIIGDEILKVKLQRNRGWIF